MRTYDNVAARAVKTVWTVFRGARDSPFTGRGRNRFSSSSSSSSPPRWPSIVPPRPRGSVAGTANTSTLLHGQIALPRVHEIQLTCVSGIRRKYVGRRAGRERHRHRRDRCGIRCRPPPLYNILSSTYRAATKSFRGPRTWPGIVS